MSLRAVASDFLLRPIVFVVSAIGLGIALLLLLALVVFLGQVRLEEKLRRRRP